jgi:tRNA nucleotidyltransferase (CCA-adding enzyme)
MHTELEQGARHIVRKLADQGYKAYMVGGYVRDTVLGKPIKDIDIATSARPDQVQSVFDKTVPTGLKHGTVTVVIGKHHYEVTTFRKESAYVQFRRPEQVEFVNDLLDDLRRRDFTMNAMAMDEEGGIVDPFGGIDDLRQKRLRCVGNPQERFREDALRMMRCLRFAANYGLSIETFTWQALLELAPLLKHIAMERIRVEMELMIEGPDPNRALDLMAESGVLKHLKRDLKLPLTASALKGIRDMRSLETSVRRWSYLLMSLQVSGDTVRHALRELTFSKQKVKQISDRLSADSTLREAFRKETSIDAGRLSELWKLAALRYQADCMTDLLCIYQFDPAVGLKTNEAQAQRLRRELVLSGGRWLAEMPVKQLSDLALTGNELVQRINRGPGPWVGELLMELLEQTAAGNLANDKQALLQAAECLLEKKKVYDERANH